MDEITMEAGSLIDKLPAWADQLLLPARQAASSELDRVVEAGQAIARRLEDGGRWLTFGAGHSWSIAAEVCSRAGGLPGVIAMHLGDVTKPKPEQWEYLADSLPERDVVNGQLLAKHYAVSSQDALLIVSNSARNGACVELAQLAHAVGCFVVAITSKLHSEAMESRHPDGTKVTDWADVVLDNRGCVGDASVELEDGSLVGGTSTIAGALLAQLLSIVVCESLMGSGLTVLRSANLNPLGQA